MGTTVSVQRQILDFENRRAQIENNAKLTPQQKVDLFERLTELSNQRGEMVKGAVFMFSNKDSNQDRLEFSGFNRALEALNRVGKNPRNLGAVEAAFQSQIDEIVNTDDKRIGLKDKSLALSALQDMIISLSDWPLENGQVNDFVPALLKEEAQLYIKGAARGLNLDSMKNSIYTDKYTDPNNQARAKWKFLDREKIKEIDDAMMHSKSTGKEIVKENAQFRAPEEYYQGFDQMRGAGHVGPTNITETSREKIDHIIVEARRQFNRDDLQNHIPELYNFVKGKYQAMNKEGDAQEVNADILHKVVFSVLRGLVEIGNKTMFESMMAENITDGRNL